MQPVAGGGILHRRVFLRRGLALATALAGGSAAAAGQADVNDASGLPAIPPWMRTPGQPFTPYGHPSPHEKPVARRIGANRLVPGNGVSWTPLEDLGGMLTPSGLHFERHHNGVPQIDPEQHRLLIHGLVAQPLTFAIDDLVRYPMQSRLLFLECGGNSNAGWHQEPIQRPLGSFHGLVSCSEWTGVPLAILLEQADVDPKASWIIAEGADAIAMNISIPLAKVVDDCFVAIYQNGEKLRPENGYPLRLIVPGWEGVLNVKWLRRLQVTDRPVMARNETGKYTELLPSGKARQFTFVIDAKSLITSPSHGQLLPAPDVYEIRGLAWSGRGRIKKVDVSADSGKTWAEADLQEPVLSRCFTRFRSAWKWDGHPAILKSRAADDTGYVQPERNALVAERGRHGYFHYNAIVAWEVDEDGVVSHVYA
ncbi:MAG: sulfite dehydrogenase [Burkholderiales bacterium]|nr:sulfite dehydrogenase [Burkholderiales bacterium]